MTPREHEILGVIRAFINANGFSPTFEELASLMGLASKASISALVKRLDEQGHLNYRPGAARSITLVSDDHTGALRKIAGILADEKSGVTPAFICLDKIGAVVEEALAHDKPTPAA